MSKNTRKYEQLNLFEFGNNEEGNYVNFSEDYQEKHNLKNKSIEDWINEQFNAPMYRIINTCCCGYLEEKDTLSERIKRLERINESECYHYGNLRDGRYISSIIDGDCFQFIFDSKKYIIVTYCFHTDTESIEDVLSGKVKICFPACMVDIFDKEGNKIQEFSDSDRKQDVRYKAIIDDWQMDKYGTNRIEQGKPIKDFCQVEITLPDLIKYFGEPCIGSERRTNEED